MLLGDNLGICLFSGDNLGVFVVKALTARQQQRTMPSSAWLLPYQGIWPQDTVIMTGPKGNYTVKDYKQFFQVSKQKLHSQRLLTILLCK